MQHITLSLTIPADEWQKLYRGVTRVVHAISEDKRRVQFPANILLPFVTHAGISGRFAITFDDTGKFQTIQRI
ncbi:MAG: DUF2835 domain-containing protein [Hahellaceae bacterium]|nr:DUF2835 domain-containing protein [Hahellaceae bacterium]